MAKLLSVTTNLFSTGKHYITCDWGYYSDGKTWHKGIDLIPENTSVTPNILAYDDGTVIATGNVNGTNTSTGTAGCGTYVAIKHTDNTITRYQHLKYNSLKVKKGDKVKKGQVIGVYGRPTTGYSSGTHLHFDISLQAKPSCEFKKSTFCNETRYYVDPKPYLIKATTTTTTKTYVVNTAALNVRGTPNGTIRRVVHKGDTLTVVSISNGWAKLSTGEYVSATYIKEK